MPVSGSPHEDSVRLGDFIQHHAAEILEAWERRMRELPAARSLSGLRLLNYLPELLERIGVMLRADGAPVLEGLPEIHALERLDAGLELDAVATEYTVLRDCVLEIRGRAGGADVGVEDVRRFNRAIDGAIIASAARYGRARERTLRAVDRISEAARGGGEFEDLLSRLLKVPLETTEAVDSAVLFLLDGDTLRVRAAVGSEAELAETRLSLKVGEGFAGKVAEQKHPLELRSAAADPMIKSAVTRQKGIRALYGLPLMDGDTVLGVARFGSLTSYELSVEDKLLIRALVQRVSVLLVEVHLRERERAARARAEESLALVNAVLANAPVGFALVDPELRYLQVNEALATTNRVPAQAHVGRVIAEVLPPDIAARVIPPIQEVLRTGQPVRGSEHVFVHDSGRILQADYFPVRTGDGRMIGVGVVLVDVTLLKRSEESLRAKHELLESLLVAQSDVGQGFAIIRDERFTYVNDALCRITGYGREELFALPTYLELVVPEQRVAVEAQMALQWEDGAVAGTAHIEAAIRHKHGFRVELEVTVKRLQDGRVIALARDITERKQAQQDREQLLAVVQTERRSMEAVLESLPVGVVLAEAPSGRIIRSNPRVKQLLGRPIPFSAGIAHYHEWRGLHPDGRPYRNEDWPLARALRTGEVISGEEMVFSGPDNSRRTLSVNAAPIRDERGAIVAAVAALHDVTAQKLAEAQLTRALLFRDRLIGILGHDLRNPLGAIKLSAALVRRDPAVPRAVLKSLARIDLAADRIGRMIDDLLDFTRIRFQGSLPVSPVDVDLHEICRVAVDELAVVHPTRVIELKITGDGQGHWDPGRMGQLVSNLVSNALQHGDAHQPVQVCVSDAGEDVVLEVCNQGEPIRPEDRKLIFEPFRRGSSRGDASSSPKGLGLGLYIVRQIVEAHGGTIEVVSSREEGTCFLVRLPRRAGRQAAPPG